MARREGRVVRAAFAEYFAQYRDAGLQESAPFVMARSISGWRLNALRVCGISPSSADPALARRNRGAFTEFSVQRRGRVLRLRGAARTERRDGVCIDGFRARPC